MSWPQTNTRGHDVLQPSKHTFVLWDSASATRLRTFEASAFHHPLLSAHTFRVGMQPGFAHITRKR